mmetsp:Transcript_27960/g.61904  ORF Transcript_27960/g.61904 Transcript_27960/m.61904 type:complete len:154 (+) Transcript_27960:851-1312(+)
MPGMRFLDLREMDLEFNVQDLERLAAALPCVEDVALMLALEEDKDEDDDGYDIWRRMSECRVKLKAQFLKLCSERINEISGKNVFIIYACDVGCTVKRVRFERVNPYLMPLERAHCWLSWFDRRMQGTYTETIDARTQKRTHTYQRQGLGSRG